jgi:tetratricopeptide (TPR) repeat protein
MSAPAHRSDGPDNVRNDAASDIASSPASATGPHLSPEDIYGLVEEKLPRRSRRAAEAHLDGCTECVETLAMVLRCERPASREEQQILSETPEPSTEELLEALREHIGPAAPRQEWKSILTAFVVAALLFGLGRFVHQEYWLPAASRRAAADTLTALVTLRHFTGRLPLRYITEFERAGVVRSDFDTTDAEEGALIFNLRDAVKRAPEPEAILVLGLLLLDAGELDEAEQLLTRAAEEIPDSVSAVNGLAVVYYERAQRELEDTYALQQRGLAYLRQAEKLDPDDLRVLYNYGKFYEALGMHGAASKSWRRYLEHDQVSQWAEEAVYQLAQ